MHIYNNLCNKSPILHFYHLSPVAVTGRNIPFLNLSSSCGPKLLARIRSRVCLRPSSPESVSFIAGLEDSPADPLLGLCNIEYTKSV